MSTEGQPRRFVAPLHIRESRIRYQLAKLGLSLKKSRRRNPYAPDFGTYWVLDPWNSSVIYGGNQGADLDDIEWWLSQPDAAS